MAVPPHLVFYVQRATRHAQSAYSICFGVCQPIADADAASLGAIAETVNNPAELAETCKCEKQTNRATVIGMKVDANEGWTAKGHSGTKVGAGNVTDNDQIRATDVDQEAMRDKHWKGVSCQRC